MLSEGARPSFVLSLSSFPVTTQREDPETRTGFIELVEAVGASLFWGNLISSNYHKEGLTSSAPAPLFSRQRINFVYNVLFVGLRNIFTVFLY